MPIINVQILEGRPKELRVALIRNITKTVAETLDAPLDSIRVIITEMPKDSYGLGGITAEEMGR